MTVQNCPRFKYLCTGKGVRLPRPQQKMESFLRRLSDECVSLSHFRRPAAVGRTTESNQPGIPCTAKKNFRTLSKHIYGSFPFPKNRIRFTNPSSIRWREAAN